MCVFLKADRREPKENAPLPLYPCIERLKITRLPIDVPPVRRKRRLEKDENVESFSPAMDFIGAYAPYAIVAQLVEQLPRKHQVVGSNPTDSPIGRVAPGQCETVWHGSHGNDNVR